VLRALVRTGRETRAGRASHIRMLSAQIDQLDVTRARQRRAAIEDQVDGSDDLYHESFPPPLRRDEWFERLRAAAPEAETPNIEVAVDAAVVANTAASIG